MVANKFETWLTGEQLRLSMHTECAQLIKDRKYHLRKYTICFRGRDTVTWLMSVESWPDRDRVVRAMRVLQHHEVIHHVCDDHYFKDAMLFFRFRKDDGSWEQSRESRAFHRGQKVYKWLVCRDKPCFIKGRVSFKGSELIEWLIRTGEAFSQEDAAKVGKELLEYDIVTSVTGDYRLRDDDTIYSFLLDYGKKRCLVDLLPTHPDNMTNICLTVEDCHHGSRKISTESSSSDSSTGNVSSCRSSSSDDHDGPHTAIQRLFSRDVQSIQQPQTSQYPHCTDSVQSVALSSEPGLPTIAVSLDSGLQRVTLPTDSGYASSQSSPSLSSCTSSVPCSPVSCTSSDIDNASRNSEITSDDDTDKNSGERYSSVMLRQASVAELEDPDTPYVKRTIKLCFEPLGYDFVLRGTGPSYVQAVNPDGPAAKAGLKVRHYIYSVNDEKVLREDYKTVSKKIMFLDSHITLVVMAHIRDASI